MIKKVSLILCFGFGFLSAQNLPESVSLEEAVAFGLENNRTIINASLEVQKAYKEKWKTIATLDLPQIKMRRADYQNFIELPTSSNSCSIFWGRLMGSLLKFSLELLKAMSGWGHI